ncbi:hypothetical protein ABW20_dc0105849 [Dactylellina cionopaga]|nr:hypothetical protein ABW20_dc0105849 [Dactylellina cionopaga]
MVGIGGGVPCTSTGDIRLGDVAVSLPVGNSGGVFQYDFGKTVEGGKFIYTGSLNKPPQILLSALSSIRAKHPRALAKTLVQRVSEAKETDDRLCYPGRDKDQLFSADYEHVKHAESCSVCDTSKLVRRPPREDDHPYVHYGIIASGNQVVKHGATRDRISQETGAICFEMEAAGLMDNFPCLVVRGICDYSDSHKNKHWQPYAAATAAAFAKELLLEIPPIGPY